LSSYQSFALVEISKNTYKDENSTPIHHTPMRSITLKHHNTCAISLLSAIITMAAYNTDTAAYWPILPDSVTISDEEMVTELKNVLCIR
jgi:hypothetical protein